MEKKNEYKLPILSLLREAAGLVKSNFLKLILIGAPFIIACVAAGFWMSPLFTADPSTAENFPVAAFLFFWLALMSTSIMAIVGCHRTFLLQGPDAPKTPIIRWGWREMRFIGKWILISLCGVLVILPIMMVVMPFVTAGGNDFLHNQKFIVLLSTVLYLPIYYVIARLMLVLPATAIDERWTLTDAWRISSGNGWRVMLLVAGIPMLAKTLISLLPVIDAIPYFIFQFVLWLFIAVYGIALLSLSFAHLSKNNEHLLTLSDRKLHGEDIDDDFSFEPDGPQLRD